MPFNERTLLAGLRVLPAPLNGVRSLAELQQTLRYDPAPYTPDERIAQREIAEALTDLNDTLPGHVSQLVDAISPPVQIGDPTQYWRKLWLSLHYSGQQLEQLERDVHANVGEVDRLFRFLRDGFDTPSGFVLIFKDQTGKKRTIPVGRITGWTEKTTGDPLTVSQAVQTGTRSKAFQRFDDYFSPIPVGTPTQDAIDEKKALLAECFDLEQKYWDVIK